MTGIDLRKVVGATGFEPATPCAQGRCATRLRYAPTAIALRLYVSFADAPNATAAVLAAPAGYWKYGFTPCGSGVLSSATIIDEI